jgi:hypothetical protein
MRHYATIIPIALLCVTSACGPETVEPMPCSGALGTFEDGEEVESPDGCVTYRCDDGVLATLDDRRVTIAGDLALASQEAVDEQRCLGVVEGTLQISGTAADLTPLGSLTRIGTGLEIIASQAATTAGLQGVTEIGGSITIADNASLTALAFHPAMSVFGDATIQNNDALASLAGAEFLGQCSACMGVGAGPRQLTAASDPQREPAGDGGSFDEAPAGGTFYGAILIADNDVLANVLAMSNLYYAWSDVRFRNNDALTSLAILQLSEVRGVLEISEHAAMSTADAEAFAARVSVLGETTICGNLDGVACP